MQTPLRCFRRAASARLTPYATDQHPGPDGPSVVVSSCENSRAESPYFFLFAASFAFVACCEVTNCCFLEFASFAFDCFCDAFFCTDFGDLSPMVVIIVAGGYLTGVK
jgi:hypothetical protein